MKYRLYCLVLWTFLIMTVIAPRPVQAETVYKFGVVPQFEPRKLATVWLPVLEELSRRTGLQFEMAGSAEIPHYHTAYLNGEFDFAFINPYHALLSSQKFGATPIVRDGSRSLKGIIVVRKDSPIQTVADLANKKIAFPAPNALGASLVVRAELKSIFKIPFNPIYVNTHSSVYLNVILGRAAAGGGVISSLQKQKPNIQNLLRVLHTTREMRSHPIMAHPRVPPEHIKSVQRAFLKMGEQADTAALLDKIPIFEPVSATIDDYLELLTWDLDYVEN